MGCNLSDKIGIDHVHFFFITLLEKKVVTTPDFMSKSVFLSQYRICEDIGETLCKTI